MSCWCVFFFQRFKWWVYGTRQRWDNVWCIGQSRCPENVPTSTRVHLLFQKPKDRADLLSRRYVFAERLEIKTLILNTHVSLDKAGAQWTASSTAPVMPGRFMTAFAWCPKNDKISKHNFPCPRAEQPFGHLNFVQENVWMEGSESNKYASYSFVKLLLILFRL